MAMRFRKTSLVTATVLLVAIALVALCTVARATAGPTRAIRLAVLSDVHYVSPSEVPTGEAGRAAFDHAESGEMTTLVGSSASEECFSNL